MIIPIINCIEGAKGSVFIEKYTKPPMLTLDIKIGNNSCICRKYPTPISLPV